MKHLLTILFIFCSLFSIGQNPLVKMWDKRFGGTAGEILCCLISTQDGGFVMAGWSTSPISGDKSQPTWGGNFDRDFWVIKIDSLGNKLWDGDFGGSDDDELNSIQETTDGGYILGGVSFSGISGNKTQNCWGNSDYWIVKIDSIGNMQWDKDFGGIMEENLQSVIQTDEGGYILVGWSYSGISGDKTQPLCTIGISDYWVVKIDSAGVKQWDKDFGGPGVDQPYCIQQASDGGYLMVGFSLSGNSCDKTQPLWGGTDYWVIKIDSLGIKQWDKDFGGTLNEYPTSLLITTDGGFVIGGYSNSPVSGNKSQPTWGDFDYWLLKLDSSGSKEWDRDYGGSNFEECFSLFQTNDNGFLLAGDSYSPISGDKTVNNMGTEQTWAIKVDTSGNKIWERTMLANGHDEDGFAIQSQDECYTIVNSSLSGIGGDKTQSSWGSQDFWFIKFCDTTFSPIVAFSSFTPLCPGTCTGFTNLTFNASLYLWSFPGASPDSSTAVNPSNICYPNPGTYDVQLIATNANGSDTLLLSNYITVYPQPPPQSISQSSDTLFAIQGAASYQWFFNTNIINGATDYFYVAQANGDYNVVATDANGCEVEAAIFNVVADLTQEVSGLMFEVYPNPVSDKLIIQSGSQVKSNLDVEMSVYNMLGEKVSVEINELLTLDCRHLPAGMYYVEINIRDDKKTFRERFIKR